ncbi:hypothetical protein BG261_05530 [Floricoccus tropicus]|uniref:Uncharacterized protein n=1 Tax=Floricoccus tropicus TaxID=1859473 RepID=A0A1E8GKS9_9LACT|nr:hypothetical protein [Floricoccus tropicus]OFI48850.1 hypothetical protein BG261_05530 [Floricoccus tropicus]
MDNTVVNLLALVLTLLILIYLYAFKVKGVRGGFKWAILITAIGLFIVFVTMVITLFFLHKLEG